jgi:hypothetical protein
MNLQTKKENKIFLWAALLFWPLIIGIAVILLNLDNGIYLDEEYKTWALAHLVLHAMPIFLYIVKFRKFFRFPFIEILAGFNIVHFALPLFFIELEDFQLGIPTAESLSEIFYAYFIFYTTFYVLMSLGKKVKGVEFIPPDSRLHVIKLYGYIFFAFYLINATFRIEAIYHIGYVGFFVYVGIFLNLWKEKLLKTWEKILYVVILLYDFIGRALDGLLAPFALLILFLVISILMSKSSKWLILISVGCFVWFYSIFSSIKYEFRSAVWYEGQYSIFDKVVLIEQLYTERKLNKATPLVNNYEGKDHMLWRFSYQMSAMSLVLQETPVRVPFWGGDTYIPLISKFIPRFMWADKPLEGLGYKFGTTYRIISTWNTKTSINTPILAELYMNFGFAGLYFGSFLLGVIYFFLSKLFNSPSVTYASSVVGMAIIFPLMIWESNFSLVFGNLLLITLTFLGLYRVMRFFYMKK